MSHSSKDIRIPEIPPWNASQTSRGANEPNSSSSSNIRQSSSFQAAAADEPKDKPLPSPSKQQSSSLLSKENQSNGTLSSSSALFPPSSRMPLSNSSSSSKQPQKRTGTTPQQQKQQLIPRSVLRYGESMETLFHLDANSSQEYRQLCRQVTDTTTQRHQPRTLEQDAQAWRRILELRTEQVEQQQQQPSTSSAATAPQNNNNSGGTDLLRLYRRVTSRFASSSLPPNPSADLKRDLLHIWLSFARAQSMYGGGGGQSPPQSQQPPINGNNSSSNNNNNKDARQTLKYVQTQQLGEDQAALYLALAELEERDQDLAAAERALRQGIQKRAEPLRDLHEALRQLQRRQAPVSPKKRQHSQQQQQHAAEQEQPPSQQQPQSPPEEQSPKRRKTETGWVAEWNDSSRNNNNHNHSSSQDNSNMSLDDDEEDGDDDGAEDSRAATMAGNTITTADEAPKESIRFQLAPLHRSTTCSSKPSGMPLPTEPQKPAAVTKDQTAEVSAKKEAVSSQVISLAVADSSQSSSNEPPSNTKPQPKRTSLPHQPETTKDTTPRRTSLQASLSSSSLRVPTLQSASRKTSLGSTARSKLPPLTMRFKPTGLSGKAERVDPSQQQQQLESESESEAESSSDTPMHKNDKKTPAKRIPKIDLDYMWNWDPEKRNTTPATQTNSSFKASHTKTGGGGAGGLGKIEETPSLSLSSSSNATGASSHSSPHHSNNNSHHSKSEHSNKSRESATSNGSSTAKSTQMATKESAAPTMEAQGSQRSDLTPGLSKLLDTANADFLPLISEDNMLRVNSVPYIKLGVIGKGGSCKVYRALSKDCSVLAIKKVKLDNLEKKAIDGYSNEIALLKRLRGNPSIIQLHDSEVDLQRKAIFLVMEPGEVDLNHVIQKQATASAGGERRLNMNFIRLTWQQMLKAVHSIHEERIIHGDLKPANFLFVRGSLKLIDFGIAKAIQSDDTTNIYRETQIGTLNYMSPEAILDSGTSAQGLRMKCGRPSDIWSLGCILYQMVYGRTPFAELHMIPKLQAIVNPNHEIKYPSNANEDAIDAMQQCLHRDPKDRAPIMGKNGLLNEHCFLNSSRRHAG